VRDTAKSSFLICDLADCDPRQTHPGAIKIVPRLSAAALIDAARSSSHRKLAEAIQFGEFAQSVRSADALDHASETILNLPLGKAANSIGRYYRALCLNRQGSHALAEADKILIDVADQSLPLFRAKALAALATNLRIEGDDNGALKIQADAARIARSCEHGGAHPMFMVAFQRVLVRYDEGDYASALAGLEKLEPIARHVGLALPAFLHSYYNNLAVFLTIQSRFAEASRLYNLLLNSPFRSAYPEWQKTCADITRKTRPRSRWFVSLSVAKPFSGEPEALPEPPAREPFSRAEIGLVLLVLKVIRQRPRRVPVRLFAGLRLRRLLLAARDGARSPRRVRAQLGLFRWSYLRAYPAYPRPPNV
jgi:hypothetical protein